MAITEIFPDPMPSVGLPAGEFVEIHNSLSFPVSLDRWRITDGQGNASFPAGIMLLPDSFLIICSKTYQQDYAVYGKTIGLSGFPSLDNDGDQLMLFSADGKLMHAVGYNSSWYGNSLKSSGGWSLEMIDPEFPCTEKNNWTASIHPSGGSPGKPNNWQTKVTDNEAPRLLRSYAKDSLTLMLLFDESLDSSIASMPDRYHVSNGIGKPLQVKVLHPFFRQVELRLTSPLSAELIYLTTATGISDCRQNTTTTAQQCKTALARPPVSGQLCINEVLFNPGPDGSDYIELFHKGNKAIDLSSIFLGSRTPAGLPATFYPCAAEPLILFPGEFLVLTEDMHAVMKNYSVLEPSKLIQLKQIPTLSDDAGTLLLANKQGDVLDELHYEEDFHFPLLSNREGVALERIDPYAPTQDRANWHSASTLNRYGTPASRNSQYSLQSPADGIISIEPKTFSPDLDGYNDQLSIQFQFPKAGYICNIILFDQTGKPVRYLVRNQLCGVAGIFRWNGLDEKNLPLPSGMYFVVAEYFNLQGTRKISRHAVVLARRH